jgi:hypothetical protein
MQVVNQGTQATKVVNQVMQATKGQVVNQETQATKGQVVDQKTQTLVLMNSFAALVTMVMITNHFKT